MKARICKRIDLRRDVKTYDTILVIEYLKKHVFSNAAKGINAKLEPLYEGLYMITDIIASVNLIWGTVEKST